MFLFFQNHKIKNENDFCKRKKSFKIKNCNWLSGKKENRNRLRSFFFFVFFVSQYQRSKTKTSFAIEEVVKEAIK